MIDAEAVDTPHQATAREGVVVAVRGVRVVVEFSAERETRIAVGSFIAIRLPDQSLIGVVTEIRAAKSNAQLRILLATVHLAGEIGAGDTKSFCRGVSTYPTIGDQASALSTDDIKLIHSVPGSQRINLGNLYHDSCVDALIDVRSLLSRHFAILGSTGVSKSSAVAVIFREVLARRNGVRIFMLDTHDEYGARFGDVANVISPRSTKLPFWLFNFDEFVDVLYGGRPGLDEELEILTELIPLAKTQYVSHKTTSQRLSLKRPDSRSVGFTVDTPIPYLLQDLLSLIDARMGKLENRSSRLNYHRLISRIEVIRNDPRYDFMFENANVGGDAIAELLNKFFRIDPQGRPITIMQLATLPTEVMDAVVSVLCRLAFDFGQWSDGAVPLLFVCEEAHRYASNDQSIGFGPTRRALSRIAKEGRKYHVYLGLVSQRPAELDPTILSQCATMFAMRLASERDHDLLKSALSDDTADLLSFLPTLGVREAIAFGESLPIPTRMSFRSLPEHLLPRNEVASSVSWGNGSAMGLEFVQEIVDRWRRSHTDRKQVRTNQSKRRLRHLSRRPCRRRLQLRGMAPCCPQKRGSKICATSSLAVRPPDSPEGPKGVRCLEKRPLPNRKTPGKFASRPQGI
jgi:DNA helicase HerA-like ATPase